MPNGQFWEVTLGIIDGEGCHTPQALLWNIPILSPKPNLCLPEPQAEDLTRTPCPLYSH